MRQELFGIPIDSLTFEETVSRAVEAMRAKRLTQHVAVNVAKLVKARRDAELRRDIAESHIVGIDGMGIVWAARMLGIAVPERVAGVDLMERLLWAGGRRLRAGQRQKVDPSLLREWQDTWLGLLAQYELYCAGAVRCPPHRRKTREDSSQLALLLGAATIRS